MGKRMAIVNTYLQVYMIARHGDMPSSYETGYIDVLIPFLNVALATYVISEVAR